MLVKVWWNQAISINTPPIATVKMDRPTSFLSVTNTGKLHRNLAAPARKTVYVNVFAKEIFLRF